MHLHYSSGKNESNKGQRQFPADLSPSRTLVPLDIPWHRGLLLPFMQNIHNMIEICHLVHA
jgi:hypothetical protein